MRKNLMKNYLLFLALFISSSAFACDVDKIFEDVKEVQSAAIDTVDSQKAGIFYAHSVLDMYEADEVIKDITIRRASLIVSDIQKYQAIGQQNLLNRINQLMGKLKKCD
jgi:hypothetical protein